MSWFSVCDTWFTRSTDMLVWLISLVRYLKCCNKKRCIDCFSRRHRTLSEEFLSDLSKLNNRYYSRFFSQQVQYFRRMRTIQNKRPFNDSRLFNSHHHFLFVFVHFCWGPYPLFAHMYLIRHLYTSPSPPRNIYKKREQESHFINR